MLLLRSLALKPDAHAENEFPFTLPIIRSLIDLHFDSPITFLVGENGSGKSTLLEALACAVGSIAAGSEPVEQDVTLNDARRLADMLKLTWSKRTKKGFFMRAEDFFGYAKQLARMRAGMEAEIQRVDEEYDGRSAYAKGLAKMPYATQIGELKQRYGDGLDSRSHGEAFLTLFRERFRGEGLYLLDEPEAPLSPMRQLSLLSLLKMMVDQGGQFIIATHSPLLMAYPGARLLNCDGGTIHPVEYETLDHVTITRSFLNDPESYLRHLLD